jgi:hypothetical protein
MTRRRLLLVGLAVAAAVALAATASAVLLAGGDEGASGASAPETTVTDVLGPAAPPDLEACAGIADDEGARACYAENLRAVMEVAADASAGLEEIAVHAYTEPSGRLLRDCHGLMHAVGREYAAVHDVTLENLMTYLPQTNEPGCSAGFAHGLVTAVAPEIDLRRPQEAAAVCDETDTRYRRYSCVHGFGHAFMRLVREDVQAALELCSALGADAPDCSQGAFHDYWFAVLGADDTEPPQTVVDDPRVLCGSLAEEFVRPCWYRAFVDNRPEEPVRTAAHLLALCAGLDGLQRQACITAAAVVGPPDPSAQLAICSELRGVEAESCVQGTKVQNLIASPFEDLVALIRQCEGFPAQTAPACYRWLGKVLSVVTDGRFEQAGCPALPQPAARRECVRGARSSDGPLVTFS